MPKMSLYEIHEIVYDIARSKRTCISEFKRSDDDKIEISIAVGWLLDFARKIVEEIK